MNSMKDFNYDWNSPYVYIKYKKGNKNYVKTIIFIKHYEIGNFFPLYSIIGMLTILIVHILLVFIFQIKSYIILFFLILPYFNIIQFANKSKIPTNSDYIYFTTLMKSYYIYKSDVTFEQYFHFYLWLERSKFLRNQYINKIQIILNKLLLQNETDEEIKA